MARPARPLYRSRLAWPPGVNTCGGAVGYLLIVTAPPSCLHPRLSFSFAFEWGSHNALFKVLRSREAWLMAELWFETD